MTQTSVKCPHCGAANPDTSAFCESCGKALPTASGPRVISGSAIASTAAGQQVQAEQLQKTAKKAAGALLAVAIIQAIFGTIIIMVAKGTAPGGNAEIPTLVYVTIYGIALAFFGLYIWARFAPLPAAIVGLVLFTSVHLLDAIADPMAITRGIIMKIIIIAILVKAIKAGLQYKQLKEQQS